MSIARSLGWLADLVAQHLYRDDVPLPMRRRWSFDGAPWTLTDDPDNEVARIELSGDFTDVPATFDELSANTATIQDLTVTDAFDAGGAGGVDSRIRVNSEGVTIGPSLPIAGQEGALWLDVTPNFPTADPTDGVFVYSWGDELYTRNPGGALAAGHFAEISNDNDALTLDGWTGVTLSYAESPMCTFSISGSTVTQTLDAGVAGFGFVAPTASQYVFFRVPDHVDGQVYFDARALVWRSPVDFEERIKLEMSSTTRIVGIPARTTNGTGANLRLRPQPVNAGRGSLDTPGSLDVDLGQVLAAGDLSSGRVNLRDHLGIAVNHRLTGQSGEGGTASYAIEGTAVGVDGRARGVSISVTSPVSIGLSGGAADITLDTTNAKIRYNTVTLLHHTVNGQALGGEVEATQNGALRFAHTGVPSAAPTAGMTAWTASGQWRTRGLRNVISEATTGKVSTTVTPGGPTRCYDRQDTRSMGAGAATLDTTLIAAGDLPAGGNWTMRAEIQWSAYDTDGDTAAGGRRFATVRCSGGTITVLTSAANQVDGTDDDETAGVILTGASAFLRTAAGELQFRFETGAGNVLSYVHARIVATLWEH